MRAQRKAHELQRAEGTGGEAGSMVNSSRGNSSTLGMCSHQFASIPCLPPFVTHALTQSIAPPVLATHHMGFFRAKSHNSASNPTPWMHPCSPEPCLAGQTAGAGQVQPSTAELQLALISKIQPKDFGFLNLKSDTSNR